MQKKSATAEEPKEDAGSVRKVAVSLLTRLCSLERSLKGVARAVSGEESLVRDADLPPKSIAEVLAESLRVSERLTRTLKHVSDKLGIGE